MSDSKQNKTNFDQHLIDRFSVAFNQIDHAVREKKPSKTTFMGASGEFLSARGLKKLEPELRQLNNLRNHLVHDQRTLHFRTAIPTLECVQRIEQIRDILIRPGTAFSVFKREVHSFEGAACLAEVMKTIHELDISQFPVVEKNKFLGLITEKVIAVWLAGHVTDEIALVDLEEISSSIVVKSREAGRINFTFVQRDAPIWHIQQLFQENLLLEAALITKDGNESTDFLGIISRWDVAHLDTLLASN